MTGVLTSQRTDGCPRVLIAAHVGKPVGGISTYFEDLLNSKLKEAVNLDFVETSEGALSFTERGRWKFSNILNSIYNIIKFAIVLSLKKPEVVHIATAHGASFAKHSVMVLIARVFGVKVALHPHCSLSRFITAERSFWKSYILFVLRQTNAIIVLSKEWMNLRKLIPDCKVRYLPNVIDINPYISLHRPGISGDRPIEILYLGHIGKEKGIFDLIYAAAKMLKLSNSPFKMRIIGESLYESELKGVREIITKNNLENVIQILSPVYSTEKLREFERADIFVLPSYHEGMPISLIEAMAAGLPIVATDVGGIPELVTSGKTGFLVSPGDIDALASCLTKLVANDLLRMKMGIAGRTRATDEFNMDNHVKSLVGIYFEALKIE